MQKTLVSAFMLGLMLVAVGEQVEGQPPGRGRRGAANPAAEDGEAPAFGRGGRGRGGAGATAGGRFGDSTSTNKLFAALDTNSDGEISVEEMDEAMNAFAKLDENKDAKLSKEEAGATGGRGGHMHGGRGTAAGAGRGRFGARGTASGESGPGFGRERGAAFGRTESDAPERPQRPKEEESVEGEKSKSPFEE